MTEQQIELIISEGIEFLRSEEVVEYTKKKQQHYNAILGYGTYVEFLFSLYPKRIAVRIIKKDCRSEKRSKIRKLINSYKQKIK